MRSIVRMETSRREVLKGGLALGAGLVIGFRWQTAALADDSPAAAAFAPNAFVRIGPDSSVTVISARSPASVPEPNWAPSSEKETS